MHIAPDIDVGLLVLETPDGEVKLAVTRASPFSAASSRTLVISRRVRERGLSDHVVPLSNDTRGEERICSSIERGITAGCYERKTEGWEWFKSWNSSAQFNRSGARLRADRFDIGITHCLGPTDPEHNLEIDRLEAVVLITVDDPRRARDAFPWSQGGS